MSFGFGPTGGVHQPHVHLRDYSQVTGKVFDWDIVRELLGYLKPHRRRMVEGAVWMLISSGLALLAPYLIKTTIDDYIAVGDVSGLVWMAVVIMVAYALDFFVGWRQRLTLGMVGNSLLRTMHYRLFVKYQELSMSYFDTHETGSLIARMASDVGVINELLANGIIAMLNDFVLLISITVVMFLLNARLALMTLSVLPIMVIATLIFGRYARVAYRNTREKVSVLTGRLAEDLSAMRVIQAFAEEDRTSRDFDQVNRDNRDAHVSAVALSSFFTPVLEVLSFLAVAIILWFGGRSAIAGTVTVGVIVAFLTYTSRLFQPILDLSMIFNTWQAAMAGGERIQSIIHINPEIQDKPDAIELQEIKGHVEFDHVDFRYVKDAPVLQDVSFEVQPGETVALVGPTGAGKTTIASLLMRFYDVTNGAVRIDGHDVRDVKLESLRQQLGVVPQEPFLFQGTIAENIAFGRPTASREEIVAAAKAANAHEFVSKLSDGYDTHIQEGSTNLSLGQRQLICLARVILVQPSILVLDEATSSVDLRTEALIQDAMQELMSGRTSLVIAHRLATVQRANMLLVIDGGRIVERGTHEELLAGNGVYAHLYQTQFLSAEPAPVG
jgi:ATP-binding cassette, subfamily B, multidrug efflux pump